MVIHPNSEWLQDIEYHIQDVSWQNEHLNRIMESLASYLSSVPYVISASSILDLCFESMLGQGRYTELVQLFTQAIATFDSLTPIPQHLSPNENSNASNAQRFPNEYFMLKLNLAHAALMSHDIEIATQQLEHIHDLYADATLVEQLEACCVFLKYHSYGYAMDLGFDLVTTTQQLAYKFSDDLRLKAENAIAYYYYATGNIHELENVLRKTNRLISKTMPDISKISVITAELNFYLAVLYREWNQYDKAFAKLDIASEQYARLNNHIQNMLVLYETAMLYCRLKQYDNALQWIDLASAEFGRLPEQQDYHRAMLEHGKGIILLAIGEHNRALTFFKRVLLIWEKYKHDYHIALATNAVGAATIHLARPIEALGYFAKAKAICRPIKEQEQVKELLKVIDSNIAKANSRLF